MIGGLLDHRCDIYKLQDTLTDYGFGLSKSTNNDYNNSADHQNIACHFKLQKTQYAESRLHDSYDEEQIIKFAVGTDVHKGDKIIRKDTNEEYLIKQVTNIRGNHLRVIARMKGVN